MYYLDYVPNDQKVISESSSVEAMNENQESEFEDDLDELLVDDESQKEELQKSGKPLEIQDLIWGQERP